MIEELNEITNSEDVIDSRDIIARISYLEDDEDRTDEESAELATLLALQAEAEPYAADWQYGETLIRATYFEDYARELARDIGMVTGAESWPLSCIDWTRAARELQQDYTSVSFDGVDYWVR